VHRARTPITIRASLLEPGFVRAELRVDGVSNEAQINPEPLVVPWVAEWTWEGAEEGTHTLNVQAGTVESELSASVTVTVTIVPTGDLFFSSNRGGSYAIYAMQSDGRSAIRRTTGPSAARQPAVRGNGTLAFVAELEPGQKTIRQIDREGQEMELLAGREPAWSSDGRYLAYTTSQEGVSQVSSADMEEGALSIVTQEQTYAGQGAWAPGGERLAYVAEREGNWDIWVALSDGSQPLRLTQDPAMDWAPAWAPDGSQIAFVSDRSGRHQIYVMNADGSGVRALTDFAQGAESPAWSPDGFWLAFVAYTGSGAGINAREIYLMQADGRNQVRLTHNLADDTEPVWGLTP
jgi:TolB protein